MLHAQAEVLSPSRARRGAGARGFVYLVLWVCCVALAIAVVQRQTEIAKLGYQTAADAAAAARQREENDRLAAQVAYLESPARIHHIATTRLGMKPPEVVVAAASPARAADRGDDVPAPAVERTAAVPVDVAATPGAPSFLARLGRAVAEVIAGPLRAEARGTR